mgnify:FL=1
MYKRFSSVYVQFPIIASRMCCCICLEFTLLCLHMFLCYACIDTEVTLIYLVIAFYPKVNGVHLSLLPENTGVLQMILGYHYSTKFSMYLTVNGSLRSPFHSVSLHLLYFNDVCCLLCVCMCALLVLTFFYNNMLIKCVFT